MINSYHNKIIFFLHFHKCGGTTINSLFNHFNKHKPSHNGNPWNKTNENIIKFWNYKKKKFNAFKKKLISQHVNFVAFEWNYFKYYNNIDFKNIELIVCLRDPYSRYISNMKMDKCNDMKYYNKQQKKWSNKKADQRFYINYNKYNYYVKMLNGYGDQPNIEVTNKHLEIAKKNLTKFSTVLILEDKDTFKLLKKYNINKITHKNKAVSTTPVVTNIDEFKMNNKYDYALYNYAVKLSRKRLKNINKDK
tara:strand:+ start:488 stop:1234 length:747 start_codon:yes stop_codon:yes gene_type:complete